MGRAPCCEKAGLKKGPWTAEEDQKLIDYIRKNGYGNWRTLPKNAGLQRCGKSCRLRWTNYLRPDIKRGRFSFEEEETIIQLHSFLGNKWSAIAARLPGRTDNEIKNYWNTHIRKKLLRMGIDPVTHRPRLDLLDLSAVLNSSQLYRHDNSQITFDSRFLGFHHLINPHLLRLPAASSLYSSDRQTDDFPLPNSDNILHQNQVIDDTQILPQLIQTSPNQDLMTLPNTTAFPSNLNPDDRQLMQYDDACHFQQNLDWQQISDGSAGLPTLTEFGHPNYGCHGSGQSVVDPTSSSDASAFQCNNFSCYNSLFSNMSTPSSVNSNYNIVNSSCKEDERESYSNSSILKFEIPDVLDVNDCIQQHFIY